MDHEADRKAFVRDMLASVGAEKPEPDTVKHRWCTGVARPGPCPA